MRVFLFLLLLSCEHKPRDRTPLPIEMCQITTQSCIDECMEGRFSMFHNNTSQFAGGAASSSMNGMGQSNTFKVVYRHCKKIWDKKKCCRIGHDGSYLRYCQTGYQTKSGYRFYGECRYE